MTHSLLVEPLVLFHDMGILHMYCALLIGVWAHDHCSFGTQCVLLIADGFQLTHVYYSHIKLAPRSG